MSVRCELLMAEPREESRDDGMVGGAGNVILGGSEGDSPAAGGIEPTSDCPTPDDFEMSMSKGCWGGSALPLISLPDEPPVVSLSLFSLYSFTWGAADRGPAE